MLHTLRRISSVLAAAALMGGCMRAAIDHIDVDVSPKDADARADALEPPTDARILHPEPDAMTPDARPPELAYDPRSKEFVVHEWGTFTSVVARDGHLLPGLHHEDGDLPGFV